MYLRVTICVFVMLTNAAYAQTSSEIDADIQLNLSTPGAKSLALGGAFVGLADDATAAYVNPAGLTLISSSEVAIESRVWGLENQNDIGGLSFFSVVYPFERWAIAFYRHELVNFEADFQFENTMDLDIVNNSISVAYRFRPNISGGISLSYYDFSIDSHLDEEGDDAAWGINVGLLWKIDKNWSVGWVYREGLEFDFDTMSDGPPAGVDSNPAAKFRTPTVYGLGIASQLTDMITITLDYYHVDSADELHLGFEYFFIQSRLPIAIRLGSWYDPGRTIQFEGDSPIFQEIFQSSEDEIHYSVGFGISDKKFQVDAAFDYSKRVKTFSLSTVVRF